MLLEQRKTRINLRTAPKSLWSAPPSAHLHGETHISCVLSLLVSSSSPPPSLQTRVITTGPRSSLQQTPLKKWESAASGHVHGRRISVFAIAATLGTDVSPVRRLKRTFDHHDSRDPESFPDVSRQPLTLELRCPCHSSSHSRIFSILQLPRILST